MREMRLMLVGLLVLHGSAVILNNATLSVDHALCEEYACPDLRAGLPRDVVIGRHPQDRWWLNFTAIIGNSGEGPLEVLPMEGAEGAPSSAFQVLRAKPGGNASQPVMMHEVGILAYHPSHTHWHVNGIFKAHLVPPLDAGDLSKGPDWGAEVAEELKLSFCLIDSENLLDGDDSTSFNRTGVTYLACSDPTARQGIAPGWSDNYPFFLEGNAFPIDPSLSGTFFLVLEVNWALRFAEKASNSNAATLNDNLSWMALTLSWDAEGYPTVANEMVYSDSSRDSNGVDWPALAARRTWYWPLSSGCGSCEFGCCLGQYPVDIVRDGVVDLEDLAALLVAYDPSKTSFSRADVNGDDRVNLDDLAALLVAYRSTFVYSDDERDCCCVDDDDGQCLFTPRDFCTYDGYYCQEDGPPATNTTTTTPTTVGACCCTFTTDDECRVFGRAGCEAAGGRCVQ